METAGEQQQQQQQHNSKAAKQTYTWSTPFFDVEFVDIRTRKGTGTYHLSVPTVIGT